MKRCGWADPLGVKYSITLLQTRWLPRFIFTDVVPKHLSYVKRPSPTAQTRMTLPLAASMHGSGAYSWRANQLEQAQENIQIGVQLNEQPKANLNLIFAYYYASQIYQAAGRGEQALDSIQRAKRLAGNASLSDECWLNAWEANLNMLQGNHIQVEHWLRMEGPKLDQKPDYLNMGNAARPCSLSGPKRRSQ